MKGFHRKDPHDPAYLVDPTNDELAKVGITRDARLKTADPAIRVSIAVHPWMKAIADRIVDRKIFRYQNAQEIYRAAIGSYLRELSSDIDSREIDLEVRRATQIREIYASVLRSRHYTETARTAYSAMRLLIDDNNTSEALMIARKAKRVWESIPPNLLTKKVQFDSIMRSGKGDEVPIDWNTDPAAVLWDRVLSNVSGIDRSDEDEQEEGAQLHDTTTE